MEAIMCNYKFYKSKQGKLTKVCKTLQVHRLMYWSRNYKMGLLRSGPFHESCEECGPQLLFKKKRRRCSPCRYCLMLFTVFASHAVFVPVFDTISTFDDDSISWGYTVSISWGKHCSHNICLGIYHRLIASPSCDDSISQYLVTVSISGYSVAMALGSDSISWYQITIFISSYTVSVSVSISWLLVMTQFHSICFWLNFIVLVLKLHKLHSICLMRHEPVFSIYRDRHYLHCICLIIYIYIQFR